MTSAASASEVSPVASVKSLGSSIPSVVIGVNTHGTPAAIQNLTLHTRSKAEWGNAETDLVEQNPAIRDGSDHLNAGCCQLANLLWHVSASDNTVDMFSEKVYSRSEYCGVEFGGFWRMRKGYAKPVDQHPNISASAPSPASA